MSIWTTTRGGKLARRISRRILRFSTECLPDRAFVSKLNPYPNVHAACKFAPCVNVERHQNHRRRPCFPNRFAAFIPRQRIPRRSLLLLDFDRCPLPTRLSTSPLLFFRFFPSVCSVSSRLVSFATNSEGLHDALDWIVKNRTAPDFGILGIRYSGRVEILIGEDFSRRFRNWKRKMRGRKLNEKEIWNIIGWILFLGERVRRVVRVVRVVD